MAANIAVVAPIIVIKSLANDDSENNGLILETINTPAVTIVAACINAETGVGPSIASGSQVWRPIWADFPIAPINKNKQIASSVEKKLPKKINLWSLNKYTFEKISSKYIESNIIKIPKIPIKNPKSPTRFTIKALIAASLALFLWYQKPINK